MANTIIDRHNESVGIYKTAKLLSELSTALVDAHEDRASLILSLQEAESAVGEWAAIAAEKGYKGDNAKSLIQAAIMAAPAIEV